MAGVDISLRIPCPTCGAAPNEKCELNSGHDRFESHLERREVVRDLELRPEGPRAILPQPPLKRIRWHPTSVA